VVLDGVVYVASRDLNFYAVDAATGAPRWRVALGAAAMTSPVISDGAIYLGVECPCRGLRTADGKSPLGALYALAAAPPGTPPP
jgi:outer membrane protein assembly factor BamB